MGRRGQVDEDELEDELPEDEEELEDEDFVGSEEDEDEGASKKKKKKSGKDKGNKKRKGSHFFDEAADEDDDAVRLFLHRLSIWCMADPAFVHVPMQDEGGGKKAKKRSVFIDDIADVDDDEEEADEDDVGASDCSVDLLSVQYESMFKSRIFRNFAGGSRRPYR